MYPYHTYQQKENLPSRNAARMLAGSYPLRVTAWLAINILIAVIANNSSLFATAHAILVLSLGFYWLMRDRTPTRVIYATAYITGAELLWRATGASVFWELGKYGVILLLALSLIKEQRLLKSPKLPFIYLMLLIPSVAVLATFERQAIAFNLSGPVALVISTVYFRQVTLTRSQLKNLLLVLLAPVVAFTFIATYGTLTATDLAFSASTASRVTAGGFGPNQVSSIMGLGIFAAFWFAVLERRHRLLRMLFILLAIWLIAQSMLTWSRGGLWTGLGSIVVGTVLLLRDRRSLVLGLTVAVLIFVATVFVVFPLLNDFTGGTLIQRLRDTDLTGRDLIMQADIETFRRYPLFGVGPGQSGDYHALTFKSSQAHTEYTRLLAEHGALGLLALIILILLAVQNFLRDAVPLRKSFSASAITWTSFYMLHAAMRLVAPAYLFGLSSVNLDQGEEEDEATLLADLRR